MLCLDAVQKAAHTSANLGHAFRILIASTKALKTVPLKLSCGLKSDSRFMEGSNNSNDKSELAPVALPPEVKKAHESAVNRGEEAYVDPVTGYRVFTELAHRKRGYCCGHMCRHCPFNHQAVKKT